MAADEIDEDEVDEEQSEETRKLKDLADFGITASDFKRSKSKDKKQKEKISKPVEKWDSLRDIDNLEEEDAIEKIKEKLGKKEHFDDVDWWIKYGEKLYYIRREEEAISAFKTALLLEPNNKTAWKKLAWCYERLETWSDVKNCWTELYIQDEKDVMILAGLGAACLNLDEYDKAKEYFSKILDIDNRNVDALDNLGYVHYELHEYKKAEECFKKSILLEREKDDVFAERYLSRAYWMLNKDDDCEKELDKLIEKKSDDHFIYHMKSDILIAKEKFDEAIGFAKESIKLKEEKENTFNLGLVYHNLKKWEFAILYYEKSLEYNQTPHTLVNLAYCYKNYDKIDKALELCEKAFDVDPGYGRALYCKMLCYKELKQYEKVLEALEDFEKITGKATADWETIKLVVEISIDISTDTLATSAQAYDEQYLDNWPDVLLYVRRLSNLAKTDEEKLTAEKWMIWAWMERGSDESVSLEICNKAIEKWPHDNWLWGAKGDILSVNKEKLDEAIQCFKKSLEILAEKKGDYNFSKYKCHIGIAKTIKTQGNFLSDTIGYDSTERKQKMQEVIKELEIAEEFIDDDWELWYEKGNVNWNIRNYHKAFEYYERAAIVDPERSEAWVCLGDTLRMLNSDNEAMTFYKKAVEIGKKEDEVEVGMGKTKRNDWVDAEMGIIEILYEWKKYQEVLLHIEKIFVLQKRRDAEAYRYKAFALEELGRYNEASDVWELGINDFDEDDKTKKMCLYNISHVSAKAGLTQNAEKWANTLINSGLEYSADGYQLLGRFLRDDEKYEDSIKILEEHLANFSDHGKDQALRTLISCCDKLDLKEKKEEYEKRLKELEEKD
tara:strand:+ start:959 stop:3475 length:2517 start_codon:yes stop_codon:yes gene_type:complete